MHFEKVSYESWTHDLKKYGVIRDTPIIQLESYWKDVYSKIKLPQRGTDLSAGYDFFMPFDTVIYGSTPTVIPSGIRWIPNEFSHANFGFCLKLYMRSSLAIKHGIYISQSVGVIDSDYYLNDENEGDILIPLCREREGSYSIKQGDRVVQGVIGLFYLTEDDNPANMERTGGVGSTGE